MTSCDGKKMKFRLKEAPRSYVVSLEFTAIAHEECIPKIGGNIGGISGYFILNREELEDQKHPCSFCGR